MTSHKVFSVSHLKQLVPLADTGDGKRFLLNFGGHAVAVANAYGYSRVLYQKPGDHVKNGTLLGDVSPQLMLHIDRLLFGQFPAKQ